VNFPISGKAVTVTNKVSAPNTAPNPCNGKFDQLPAPQPLANR
jgi:hypothetical protein